MFLGHFAVGFASKKITPNVPLWLLMVAPVFLDVLWPIFLILGIETVAIDPGNTVVTPLDLHNYPWSHSLLLSLVWSLVFGVTYFAAKRNGRAAAVLTFGVFSHWILDFITHRPDIPLYPGSQTEVGLGLWNSLLGTLVAEFGLLVAGLLLYRQTMRTKNRGGFWALISLVISLVVIYLANVFGPPPPSVQAIKVGGMFMWVFFVWAAFIDRHSVQRESVIRIKNHPS